MKRKESSWKYRAMALIIRATYALMRILFPVQYKITFLSRQSNRIPLDFALLIGYLKRSLSDLKVAVSCRRRQSLWSVLRDIYLVATSRVCVLDGYNPAVCIPKLNPHLVVIQLWHALGAIKKFGWQAVGTSAGRPREMAEGLSMHAQYTYVVASGTGCVPPFSQAFRCSEQSFKVLGMPRMDYLLGRSFEAKRQAKQNAILAKYPSLQSSKVNILYAPTFRSFNESKGGQKTVLHYANLLSKAFSANNYNLIANAHPINAATRIGKRVSKEKGVTTRAAAEAQQNGGGSLFPVRGISSIDLLHFADYVITDYSAIAFEAALLKKKVLFLVPDIEDYRRSPGLNIDIEELFPQISFHSAHELAGYITKDLQNVRMGGGKYPSSGFWQHCSAHFVEEPVGSTKRIARLIKTLLE